ncbi:MAG: hypothetical protein WKG01_39335 [Kofleriaceae bacterium]
MQSNLATEDSLRGLGLPAWALTVVALALACAAALPRPVPHHAPTRTIEPRVGRCGQHAMQRVIRVDASRAAR